MLEFEQESDQVKIGAELEGSGKQFFENVVLDNILESMLELTAAVWTYHDRVLVLERVLQDLVGDGKDISDLVEAYRPTTEETAVRTAERAELVENVFRSFARRPVSSRPAMNEGKTS